MAAPVVAATFGDGADEVKGVGGASGTITYTSVAVGDYLLMLYADRNRAENLTSISSDLDGAWNLANGVVYSGTGASIHYFRASTAGTHVVTASKVGTGVMYLQGKRVTVSSGTTLSSAATGEASNGFTSTIVGAGSNLSATDPLVVMCSAVDSNIAAADCTPDTGFTETATTAANDARLYSQHRSVTGAYAAIPQWTRTSSLGHVSVSIALVEAGGAAVVRRMMLMGVG